MRGCFDNLNRNQAETNVNMIIASTNKAIVDVSGVTKEALMRSAILRRYAIYTNDALGDVIWRWVDDPEFGMKVTPIQKVLLEKEER